MPLSALQTYELVQLGSFQAHRAVPDSCSCRKAGSMKDDDFHDHRPLLDTQAKGFSKSLDNDLDKQASPRLGVLPMPPAPGVLHNESASTLDSQVCCMRGSRVPAYALSSKQSSQSMLDHCMTVQEDSLLLPLCSGEQAQPAVPPDRVALGMMWYALSSVFFSGMGICAKQLGRLGYPVWEITLFRAILILSCSLSVLFHAGALPATKCQLVRHCRCTLGGEQAHTHAAGDNPLGNRRFMLVLRGTAGFGSVTCYFFACQLLPIADATTLTFLAPLIVAILSPALLKERMSPATLVVIPVCLAGVLLITQPAFLFGTHARSLSGLGIALGLMQPFFSAGAKVCQFVCVQSSTYVQLHSAEREFMYDCRCLCACCGRRKRPT